ncbi:BnaCnng36460D, partial [Brassica napus]
SSTARLHSPPVNGNPPVVPDTSTPSEAADFRISEVLRDLNIVPDHSLPANTVDNLDAELDTANGSSLHTSIVADSQLQAEQRDVQVEDLVTANDITEHNNQSLGVSFFVVENPDSEEFEKEDMHIPFYLDDMPSFSLGLSQEDAPVVEEMPNSINYVSPPMAHEKEAPEPRKSKRSRIIPAGLQDYKCDPKVNAEHCIIPDVDHRFTLMEQKVMKES